MPPTAGKANMAKMLKAEPAALDLVDEATLAKTDADLAKIMTDGLNKMPSYKGKLSDEEMAGVVAYVRGLAAPKAEPAAEATADEAAAGPDGAALYLSKCGSCHGKDGKGNAAMTKAFKVELAALSLVDEATLAKTDEELVKVTMDGLNKMPAYKGKLTEAEVAAIVGYLRAQ